MMIMRLMMTMMVMMIEKGSALVRRLSPPQCCLKFNRWPPTEYIMIQNILCTIIQHILYLFEILIFHSFPVVGIFQFKATFPGEPLYQKHAPKNFAMRKDNLVAGGNPY